MSLFHAGLQPALDSDGNPISGATWNFYRSGTTTPTAVYSNATLATSLGSSVASNAAGRFAVMFLDDGISYRAILKDTGGATLKDIDPVNGSIETRVFITPEQYGATGDGATDDRAAIQDAIDALEAAGGGVVRFRGASYKINSGLTVDIALVSLEGSQTHLDFTGMTSGYAITVTGSVAPPYTQNGNGLRYLNIEGPGGENPVASGIRYVGVSGGAGPSHIHNVGLNIYNFDVGEAFDTGAYLISNHDCDTYSCNVAVDIVSGEDMGEALRRYGGTIYNNDLAFRSASAGGAPSHSSLFFGTSFDYNDKLFEIEGGVLNLFGCHQEATDYAAVPIEISGNGSGLVVVGGRWLLAAPSAIPHWINCGEHCSAVFDKVMMHNASTSTGEFSTGVGHVAILGGGPSYEINAKPVVVNPNYSRLADGGFEGAAIEDNIFISDDTAAITNRFTGANGSLTISAAQFRTGAQSLKYTKVGAASTASTFAIAAPVTPGGMVGGRFYYRKPGAQTGTLSFIYVFGRLDSSSDGVPILSSFEEKGQNDVVFTAADSGWTGVSFGASETWRAPPWATHFLVLVTGLAMDAGDIYFDDVSIDMIG